MNNDTFKQKLGDGEFIQWTGKAVPFELINNENKNGFILRWVLCAAVAVAMVAAYLASVIPREVDVQPVVILALVFLPILTAVRPALDKRTILNKFIFAVTNRRAIIFNGQDVHSFMALDKAVKATVTTNNHGVGNVLLGKAADIPKRKLLEATVVPIRCEENRNNIVGMVFYNIPEAKEVGQLFDKLTQPQKV